MQTLPHPSSMPSLGGPAWFSFPANRVAGHPSIRWFTGKAIWLVIPMQYYVLTHMSGGFHADSYVPAAAMAVACVLAILLVSWVAALIYPWGGSYGLRVRSLMMTLLMVWSGSLGLLTLSYLLAGRDVITNLICDKWNCPALPGVNWQTFLGYSCYAVLASVGLNILIRSVRTGKFPRKKAADSSGEKPSDEADIPQETSPAVLPEPDLLLPAVGAAVVMMLLHRVSWLA